MTCVSSFIASIARSVAPRGDELSGSHEDRDDGSGQAGVARGRIVHGSQVVQVDAEGRIAERRTDLELDPDRLLASLRRLLG